MKKAILFFPKKIALIAALSLLTGLSGTYAQGKIIDFKATINKHNEHDWTVVEITPAGFDPYQAENKKKYKVYGVLICYTLNGEQKAARQDMTRQLVEKGKYTYTLSYSKNSSVGNISIEYFDATQPASTYPKKSSCYEP